MAAMDVHKSKRLIELPPFLFMETRRRIREARARGVDVISLGVGDPDRPAPGHVIEALAAAAADPDNHRYPPGDTRGLPAYREAVAAWYRRRFGVDLDPATEVVSLIGSKEGNHHLALGLLDPGALAIVANPGYPAYEASVILAGARTLRVPLRREHGFLMDFDEIPAAEAQAATIAWLGYPNNPTTAVAPLEFFARAVEFARTYEVLLVNDNPYSELAFDGLRVPSILEIDGAKEVAVEFNSLSKSHNMAGWRIGMAVGNAAALAAIAQVKENTDVGIFAAVQYAGIAALTGPQTVIEENIAIYQRRRDRAVATLREVGLDVFPPRATFYVWARVPDGTTSTEFANRLLELTGVVVTPGVGYGSGGEGYIRLSLGIPDDRLDEALHRIGSVRDRLGQQ